MPNHDPAAIEFLKTRKSAPLTTMGDPGPSQEELDTILEIAARVPDHGRLEPWRFVVIEREAGRAMGDALEALARKARPGLAETEYERDRNRLNRAPVAVMVVYVPKPHETIPQWEMFLSAGAAAMNLTLAATAMGYGANWVTGWFCDLEEGRALLGLTAQERVAGIVHIGTVAKDVADRPRPDVAALTTRLEGGADG